MANDNDDILKAADREAKERLRHIDMVTSNVAKLRAEMNQKIAAVERQSAKMSAMTDRNLSKLSTDVTSIKGGMAKQNQAIKTVANQKGVKEVQSSVNSMLQMMTKSVDHLARGVKSTSSETMRVTKDAISQYGKAISEDISINKQNAVAMAMAQATPLFGYFVGKFMDTEIYGDFTNKIKQKFSDAFKAIAPMFTGIFRQLGEKMSNLRYLFGRGPKVDYSEESLVAMGSTAANVRRAGKKAEELRTRQIQKKKVPKLQEGGVVRKTGLAKVHRGEVVMPIEELLKEIDQRMESGGDTALSRTFIGGLTVMSQEMAQIEKYVAQAQKDKPKEQRGLVGTFVDAFKKAKDPDTKWQDRLLRAILELKTELVGTTDRWRLAWQETLIQHPTFRNLLTLTKGFHDAISFPLRYLFTARGGYMGEWRRATRSKNVFHNIVGGLGLMYTNWSPKFDLMAKSMSQLSDEAYEEATKDKTYTKFEQLKAWVEGKEKPGGPKKSFGETLFSAYTGFMGLDRDALESAGITTFADMTPTNIMKKAGVSSDLLKQRWREGLTGVRSEVSAVGGAARRKTEAFSGLIKDTIQSMVFDAIVKGRGAARRTAHRWRGVDKKQLAVKSALFAASGGWTTGMGMVGEGGRFDREAWERKKQSVRDLPETMRGMPGEFRRDPRGMAKKAGGMAFNYGLPAYMLGSRLVPKLQAGGFIKKTGQILAHKGELILPVRKVFELIHTFAVSTHEIVQKLEPLTKLKGIFQDLSKNIQELAPRLASATIGGIRAAAAGVGAAGQRAAGAFAEFDPLGRLVSGGRAAITGAKQRASAAFEGAFERAKGSKELVKSKTPFTFAKALAEKTKFGLSIMGFYEKALQLKHDMYQKRVANRDQKIRQKMDQRIEMYDLKTKERLAKHGERTEKFFEKANERDLLFLERTVKNREKGFEDQKKRESRWATFKEKLELKFSKRMARFREWNAFRSVRDQNKIFRSFQKKMLKDRINATKEVAQIHEDARKKSLDEAKAADKRHRKVLKFYQRLHSWSARREERRQKRILKAQDKMAKKREKLRSKVEKIREKIEKEKLRYERKLEAQKARSQSRAERKLQKMKLRVEIAKAKQQARRDRRKNKIELKLEKEKMKKERIAARIKAKADIARMKIETKKLKEQMKAERKQMRKDIWQARFERLKARKEMWAGRWKRLLDFPSKVVEIEKSAKERTRKHMSIAKRQLDRLTTIGQFQKKIAKSFPGIAKLLTGMKKGLKRLGNNFVKYLLLGLQFLGKMFGPIIGSLGAVLTTLGGGALAMIKGVPGAIGSGLGAIGGAAKGLAGGSMLGAAGVLGGAGGLAWGALDAWKGTKKAKDWGTSKTGAGIGGFLGGTGENFTAGGALKGAGKGALIGAGIGSIVPGFGTAIGGAIGAIAGGILGFIGGQNIAKAMDWIGGKIKALIKGIVGFILFPYTMTWKIIKWAKGKIVGMLSKIPFVGKHIKKWAEGSSTEEKAMAAAEDAQKGGALKESLQRGGIIRHAVNADLHPGEAVVPLPPGVAESMARSVMSPADLAKRQAGMDIARTRAGVNPLLADGVATRNAMGQGNGAVVTSVNNVVNAVASNNRTAATNVAGGGMSGRSAGSGGIDYAAQVVMGDIG